MEKINNIDKYMRNKRKVENRIARFLVAITIVVLISVTAVYYVNDNNKEFENYKTKYQSLVVENSELKDQLEKLETSVKEKDGEIKSKDAVIEKIQSNYNTLNKQIDKLISVIQN